MKVIHEIRLNQYSPQYAGGNRLQLGTSHSYGIERLHLILDEGWDGLAVTATFHSPAGLPVRMLMDTDGMVDVPPEATASAGLGKIVISGAADGVRRISCNLPYTVMEHAHTFGGTSTGPTPDVISQILASTLEDRKAAATSSAQAEDAASIAAASARAAAESEAGSKSHADNAASSASAAAAQAQEALAQAKASGEFDGVDGITPHIGDNGNWYLGNTDTGIKAAGSDGTTPTIGANGNWWIGGKDTGMAAAGQAATIEIVGTETLPADQPAAVVEEEDSTAQARKYTVKVPQGNTGATPDIKIGTVETLPAGSAATASMTGTPGNPLLNLGIPKGADGSGSAENWRLVNTVTTAEDVSSITITQDSDGNALSLKKVKVFSKVRGNSAQLSAWCRITVNNLMNYIFSDLQNTFAATEGQDYYNRSRVDFAICAGRLMVDLSMRSLNGAASKNTLFYIGNTGYIETYPDAVESITSIRMWSPSAGIGAGTEIQVYGVNAL